ncbi:hypothetical protein BDY19DRAFT_950266 [Irpex rosettiformis]|uniref:Uncharacterized protein n=1 Tax=Irpex rosettiformis TaxID=378272 RepID=A0ACB8U2V0_9APHY|nr:hypothetical protein BDY19DRAFT_950266 [Irpex rosettiformis]
MKMRKAVIERKRAVAGVWDELELPSCGSIYRSPRGSPFSSQFGTQQTRGELPIIQWKGRTADGLTPSQNADPGF